MARTDPSRLQDLAAVLEEIRTWTGIEERSAGTFYLRRQPFLHFHVGAGTRRADVKTADGWLQVQLPEPLDPADEAAFRHALAGEHQRRTQPARSRKRMLSPNSAGEPSGVTPERR